MAIRHWLTQAVMSIVSFVRLTFVSTHELNTPSGAPSPVDEPETEPEITLSTCTALILAPQHNPVFSLPIPDVWITRDAAGQYAVKFDYTPMLRDCRFGWADYSMGTIELSMPANYSYRQVFWAQKAALDHIDRVFLYPMPVEAGFIYRHKDRSWRFRLKGVDERSSYTLFGHGYSPSGWLGLIPCLNDVA